MMKSENVRFIVKADIKENKRSKSEEKEILERSKEKVFSNPEVLAALKELSKM